MRKLYSLLFILLFSLNAPAQSSCPGSQQFDDEMGRCVDAHGEHIIALGLIRPSDDGQNYILEDDKRGDITLILNPTLIEAIKESPADSYEIEGVLTKSKQDKALVVDQLRPIE